MGNSKETDAKQLSEIPNCVADLLDDFAKTPFWDPEAGRRFMFFPQEIALYRDQNVAPPARHFILRMKDMIAESNVALYEEAACQQCSKMLTVAKNKSFTNRRLFCKPCYLQYLEKNG